MARVYNRKKRVIRKRRVAKKAPLVRTLSLASGFPKLLKVKHRYADNFILSASTANAIYRFSCNGMYDPNITATGHSPMYFDQVAYLYDQYTVIGSKITWTFINDAATPVTNVAFMINDDTTTSSATTAAIAEQSSGRGVFMLSAGGSQRPVKTTQFWSQKKNFGRIGLSASNFRGTSTSNPLEESYYEVAIRPQDTTTGTTVRFDVLIEYIAIWSELRDLPQS